MFFAKKASSTIYILLAIIILALAGTTFWMLTSTRETPREEPPLCGDGTCQPRDGETCRTCPEDCECPHEEPEEPETPPEEPPATGDPLLVRTTQGLVKGTQIRTARVWLGVPFAKPPVGNLRFAYAQDAEPWSGVKNTIEYPAPCAQGKNPVGINPKNSREDCLYLNIFAPQDRDPSQPLPVIVEVHGGSNLYNSPTGDTYKNEDLFIKQRNNVILVTIQYRLGPLGWMPHPALTAEAGSSGNYGLSDIIKALEWVQKNIKNFGGDPNKVLATGGSSGSIDLCAVIASPKADGLINGAWMRSGTCAATNSRAKIEQIQGIPLAEVLGCTETDKAVTTCLRSKTQEQIFDAFFQLGEGSAGTFNPVYDTSDPFVPDHPEKIFAAGKQARATMIIGAQIHDSWRPGDKPVKTQQELNQKVTAILSEYVPQNQLTQTLNEVLAMYPASQYSSLNELSLVLRNDFGFNCANRRAAKLFSSNPQTPAYWYVFTHAIRSPETGEVLPVFHGSINEYWNQKIRKGKSAFRFDYTPTPDDIKIADYMMDWEIAAARTENPNNPSTPQWPTVTPSSATPLLIQVPALTPTDYHKQQCDYYDNIVKQARGF